MGSRKEDFITGDGRLVNIDDIADVYRNVMNLSSPASGKIQRLGEDNSYSLTCHFDTTDCDVLESIKTSKSYFLTTATMKNNSELFIESVRSVTDPYTVSEIAVTTSENGRFIAKIRSPTNRDQVNKRQFLEIWDMSRLIKTIDIEEIDTHGQINTDLFFSSFRWSPFGEQDKLLYVCQKKKPMFDSFFNQRAATTGVKSSKNKLVNLGDDHTRQENWGEGLESSTHTVLAMLDVAIGCHITTIDMEGCSLADSRWLEEMKTISVAYLEDPKRLGLIYTNNRPSYLIVHDWNKSSNRDILCLKSDTQCFHTPRVSHSGRKFIYLATPAYGTHNHSVKMHLYDVETNTDSELIDQNMQVDHFIDGLSDNCFSDDDKHILFVKTDLLYKCMCLYSLESRTIRKIEFPTVGIHLLDFRHNIILASGSEINATPTLFVSVLNPVNCGELVAWHQIEDCIHLDEIEYKTYQIPTADGSSAISAIVISPIISKLQKNFVDNSEQKDVASVGMSEYELPTVLTIHGGPHAAFTVGYMPYSIIYARHGIRLLLVNYRGSSGVNEEYMRQLCGKVGAMDVDDCLQAVRFLTQRKVINPDKLVVQGGSHGGFLACHLSCQEEFKFTSAIIRNPVVDIASCLFTSDIPDWSFYESLNIEYDHKLIPDGYQLMKMYECSPMVKHDQAYVPTLLLLGSEDKRVKMFQGERWFELLKAKGVKAQCKVYADRHDLGKVISHSDGNISAIMWILSNLQKSSEVRSSETTGEEKQ